MKLKNIYERGVDIGVLYSENKNRKNKTITQKQNKQKKQIQQIQQILKIQNKIIFNNL